MVYLYILLVLFLWRTVFSHSSLMEYTLPCSHLAEEETSAGVWGLAKGMAYRGDGLIPKPILCPPPRCPYPALICLGKTSIGQMTGAGGGMVASNHGQLA